MFRNFVFIGASSYFGGGGICIQILRFGIRLNDGIGSEALGEFGSRENRADESSG